MGNRRCGICDVFINELGSSPFCEHCKKILCPTCEKKHDKEECREGLNLKNQDV